MACCCEVRQSRDALTSSWNGSIDQGKMGKIEEYTVETLQMGRQCAPASFPQWLAGRLQGQSCPVILHVVIELAEMLVRVNRLVDALAAIAFARKEGCDHPLLDEIHAKLLWIDGQREEALRLAENAQSKWNRDYIQSLLQVFQQPGSHQDLSDDQRRPDSP